MNNFLNLAKSDNMLAKRIIPCLDIRNGRTVKGTNFINLRDAGDPVELGRLYSEQGVLSSAGDFYVHNNRCLFCAYKRSSQDNQNNFQAFLLLYMALFQCLKCLFRRRIRANLARIRMFARQIFEF